MSAATVEESFRHLVAAFAAPAPLPAGGAAGITAIAMGLGLGRKVLAISQPEGVAEADAQLRQLLDRLLPAFAADCDAFARLLECLRLARDDPQRQGRVAAAWREATAAPVAVAVLARAGEATLARLGGRVKPSVRADLEAALELVRAGGRIAERNARENAQRLQPAIARELLAGLDSPA